MKWILALLGVLTIQTAALPADWRGQSAAFPLRVAEKGSYLEDASGRPFLVNGDTAWSLIVELRREEVETYLADRRRQGFNALLVNLIEHQFGSHAPANAYGEPPFMGESAFSALNDRYFDHAAWVVERAEQMGFLVFLAPAYLGAGGGEHGWYREMVEADADTLLEYGMFVARRLSGRSNIVWIHGGDFDAPEKEPVRAIAAGIFLVSPDAIQTVHSNRDTITAKYWVGEKWLRLDTVYTYDETYPAVLARTGEQQTMPVVMIEGLYEGEHGTDEEMIRRQAYATMLAGAGGHIFGNNPIWHFSSGGLYEAEKAWQQSLGSRGARSMMHFRELFESLPWWLISPGTVDHGIAADSAGSRIFYAASASDGSFSLAYLSDGAALAVKPEDRRNPLRLDWFDPSDGKWHEHPEPILSSIQPLTLFPPAPLNAAGYHDWVALIRDAE